MESEGAAAQPSFVCQVLFSFWAFPARLTEPSSSGGFMTTLMRAIVKHDVTLVNQLIQQGCDVNQLDAAHNPPLVMAAYQGDTEIVSLLLNAGADVRAVDPSMRATALHAAAYAGRVEAAQRLIAHGIDINKQGPYNGYTALHDAIWQNHIDVARVIIDAGADLSLRSNDGQTPLEFARDRGRREIAQLLEAKMASVHH
jgi:ankyrin repeat protein